MKIKLPGIEEQQRIILEESSKEAIEILTENLKAESFPGQTEIDESQYSRKHLLREREGWEKPHPDIVRAYFEHFKTLFPEYNSDKKIANLLGLSSDRRIREYKNGDRNIPYGIWRNFLVLIGKAPQDVMTIMGIIK